MAGSDERRRLPVAVPVLLFVLAVAVGAQAVAGPPQSAGQRPGTGTTDETGQPAGPVARGPAVVVAAGDISACAPPSCAAGRTAGLVRRIDPELVLTLGDTQYDTGAPAEFAREYDKTWGTFKGRTRPAPGNHEYLTPGARGYYQYFGKRAHRRHSGYYSFGIRGWHMVALNSNDGLCNEVGCERGSKQLEWLQRDLRTHPRSCVLGYFHHPPWASSANGGNKHVRDMWQALARHHADIVLTGHNHNYERFAPRGPAGAANARGVRQFIVGTGGVPLNLLTPPYAGLSRRVIDDSHGVLRLALRPTSYRYTFVTPAGRVLDRGGPISCR